MSKKLWTVQITTHHPSQYTLVDRRGHAWQIGGRAESGVWIPDPRPLPEFTQHGKDVDAVRRVQALRDEWATGEPFGLLSKGGVVEALNRALGDG